MKFVVLKHLRAAGLSAPVSMMQNFITHVFLYFFVVVLHTLPASPTLHAYYMHYVKHAHHKHYGHYATCSTYLTYGTNVSEIAYFDEGFMD